MALNENLRERLQMMDSEKRSYALGLLPAHLAAANRHDRLHSLLTDFQFIDAKASQFGIHALIDDCELCAGHVQEIALVQQALRLSTNILDKDSGQLGPQLLGRLLANENQGVCRILDEVKQTMRGRWLRPLTPSLTRPGGPLNFTLEGLGAPINAIAITPDSRNIISASRNHVLKMWDRASGTALRLFNSDNYEDLYDIRILAVTAGGSRLISLSSRDQLTVWELKKGNRLISRNVLCRHSGDLAVTANGIGSATLAWGRTAGGRRE